MSWSLNEFAALCTKAARGAGIPAGQAMLFGQAAVRHLSEGRAEQDLIDVLEQAPNGPLIEFAAALSSLDQQTCTLPTWGFADLAHSYVETLRYEVTSVSETNGFLEMAIEIDKPAVRKPYKRLTPSRPLIDLLSICAERTFVPDSAASREAGAGAGLFDND